MNRGSHTHALGFDALVTSLSPVGYVYPDY